MPAPINNFKLAIQGKQTQIGLWFGLANGYSAELLTGAGFDWFLIDAEHSTNDLRTILDQLQAVAPYSVSPIVRPPWPDSVRIKQILDLDVQTIPAPMVEKVEQAQHAIAAKGYPPEGKCGVGNPLAGASQFNWTKDYLQTANQEVCVLLQIKIVTGVTNLDDILKVKGVEGIFIDPADLSASMGYIENSGHPEVQGVIENCISRIIATVKAAGILMGDKELAKHYIKCDALFVGVGTDTGLLLESSVSLAATFKPS